MEVAVARSLTLDGALEGVVLDAEDALRLGARQVVLLGTVIAALALGHLVLVLLRDPARVVHNVNDVLPRPLADGRRKALTASLGSLNGSNVSGSYIANIDDAASWAGQVVFALAAVEQLPDARDGRVETVGRVDLVKNGTEDKGWIDGG